MKSLESYEICYPDPLKLKVDEEIQLFEKTVPDKWRGWKWCRDKNGKEGWISESYFRREGSKAIIIRDYNAKEISVQKGEELGLVYEDCGWVWCSRTRDGEEGWLPAEILDASMDIPSFETNRLLLKVVKIEYADSYEENFVDYEVIQHLSSAVPWPYPKGGVKSFLKDFIIPELGIIRWTWCIFEKNSPEEVIGVIDLWKNACPENRGFWLARKHWGKGYMSEAVDVVMDYAFNELGFVDVTLTNAVGNLRSRRVKEKSGAVLVGTKPAKFVSGKYTETEIWKLTKDEWFKNKVKNNE